MICPYCGSDNDQKVTRTIPLDRENARERLCKNCHRKFITVEKISFYDKSVDEKAVST